MDGVKALFASKTVWAGIVSLVAALVAGFGYTISPTDQAAIVDLIVGLAAALGGAGAIYGRIAATKVIGKSG